MMNNACFRSSLRASLLALIVGAFCFDFSLAASCPPIPAAEAKSRIGILSADVRHHDRLYYNESRQEIADGQYDALRQELRHLEDCFPALAFPSSPTKRVGSDVPSGTSVVKHEKPMLSLKSSLDSSAVERLLRKAARKGKEVRFLVQPKIDGLPVELVYEEGVLVSASTRGDGETGQNVTANTRKIAGIPGRLKESPPSRLVLRGEVYADLRAMAKSPAKDDLARYATPRHLASGTLQSDNPSQSAIGTLRFFPFEVVTAHANFHSDTEALHFLGTLGFTITRDHYASAVDIPSIRAIYREYLTERADLPFALDGIVVKVDDLGLRRTMGEKSTTPQWAAAWKFPPVTALTSIKRITWTTGRTGRRTPVAELEAVQLGKIQVSRVSIHSPGEARRFDAKAGDVVVIGLMGEASPQLLDVIGKEYDVSKRAALSTSPIDGCLKDSPGCREQFISRLVYFTSDKGLDIAGLGRGRIKTLVESGLLPDIPSLFQLDKEKMKLLPGFGESSADQLSTAIRKSILADDFRTIRAIGIPGIGKTSVRHLQEKFSSLDAIMANERIKQKSLTRGDTEAAAKVRRFFRSRGGSELLSQLRKLELLTPVHGENVVQDKVS